MATLVTRSGKGSPLTHAEVDANFTNLNTDKLELSGGTMTGNLSFGDNDKAIFGASSDLKIYHDTSSTYGETASVIADTGTGPLKIAGGLTGRIELVNSAGDVMLQAVGQEEVNLYYNNNIKLATTSTGVDITGTLTSDGLTVDGDAKFTDISPAIILSENDTTNVNTRLGNYGGDFSITTVNDSDVYVANRLTVDHATGDISFYEDTGTTAKFFWDASAESLGIGTSAINGKLDIANSDQTNGVTLSLTNSFAGSGWTAGDTIGTINFRTDDASTTEPIRGQIKVFDDATVSGTYAGNNAMSFSTGYINALYERMRIDSSGNVGIGTSSPDYELHVADTDSFAVVAIQASNTSNSHVFFGDTDDVDIGRISYDHSIDTMSFRVNTAEAMRIDSSGNLLVGKTTGSLGTAGSAFFNYGLVEVTRDGNKAMTLNRLTSDGDIVQFAKDSTVVGSIGVSSTTGLEYMYIGSGAVGLLFDEYGTDGIRPFNTNGTLRDNAIDLGSSTARFDDVYATNGTIQTSDQNEKQDIAELSDAEQRVAVAAKGLLRKFRWRDAVEEKGDEARAHFGIIAQDLQAAFAAEGLDAGDYAMFIHSTWTDEETGEERSRMGVRYSELLAFIIAAI